MSDAVETLPNGARQSAVDERFDLFPPHALLAVAAVLSRGAEKYGEGNWIGLPVHSHLNHAVRHVYQWLSGDRSEEHLSHAACRLLMAVERQRLDDSWSEKSKP